MTDLKQLFRPSKVIAPRPYLSQKTHQNWKSEIQFVPPPKTNQFVFEKHITKDIKSNISRYNMEQQLELFSKIRRKQTIYKSIAINFIFFVMLYFGVYSFYKWLHIALISTFIIMYFYGFFTLFKIQNRLEGKFPFKINNDSPVSQNSKNFYLLKWVFLTIIHILITSLYYQISTSILEMLSGLPSSNYSCTTLTYFTIINSLMFILKQIYYKAFISSHFNLRLQNSTQLRPRIFMEYPPLIIKTLFAFLSQSIFIGYLTVFYFIFAIFGISYWNIKTILQVFSFSFLISQFLSLIAILSFIHFTLWICHLTVLKYEQRINNINVYVSLLKLQHKEINSHIHSKCLSLILYKLNQNQFFMDRQIKTSKYYKNYWDIFDDYLNEQLALVLKDHLQVYGKLKQAHQIRSSKKTILQDLFIHFRIIKALFDTQFYLLKFVNKMERLTTLFSILDKGRNHSLDSETHTGLTNQSFTNMKDLANKCLALVNNNQKACSTIISNGLYNHYQLIQKLCQILKRTNN